MGITGLFRSTAKVVWNEPRDILFFLRRMPTLFLQMLPEETVPILFRSFLSLAPGESQLPEVFVIPRHRQFVFRTTAFHADFVITA